MTKHFDKWLKIKFYILCYPSHGNMKTNTILGHVDFFWIFFNIINKNLFNYLMSTISKKKNLNKHLSKSPNLNVLIIF
jgi:hypothetical protein